MHAFCHLLIASVRKNIINLKPKFLVVKIMSYDFRPSGFTESRKQ